MKNYAICENKCLVETYSKEQIDEKISQVGNVAVLTGQLPLVGSSASQLSVDIEYPEGFTPNNSVVVNAQVGTDKNGAQMCDYSISSMFYISVKECTMPSNKLILSVGLMPGAAGSFTTNRPYKLVLMKVA